MLQLEKILTHPKAFGLRTATPLQRAVCRASDGLPLGDLWSEPAVQQAFGDAKPAENPPKVLCVLAAIRSAKTLLAAGKAIQTSQTVDVSMPWISVGDEIRTALLSINKDRARQAYSHVLGNVRSSLLLRKIMIGDPTTETLNLRHPSGRKIEVQISAMARAGSALVSRWLAAVIFDEAPRMIGAEEGVLALDDAMTASAGRVLPGGQTLLIGSPWAPYGPVYDLVQEYWGRPDRNVCVVRAPGPAMNPLYWTAERCEDLQNHDPKAYQTDVLGEFEDPESAMFSLKSLDGATRRESVRPPQSGWHYSAALDPGIRSSLWTLVIVGCKSEEQYQISKVLQIGGFPVEKISDICLDYSIDQLWVNPHTPDKVINAFGLHGINAVHDIEKIDTLRECMNLQQYLDRGQLELPPDLHLKNDLIQTRKKVTQNGVVLELPKTSNGRHCDYVPVLSSALLYPPEPPDLEQAEQDEIMQAAINAVQTEDTWESRILRFTGHQ